MIPRAWQLAISLVAALIVCATCRRSDASHGASAPDSTSVTSRPREAPCSRFLLAPAATQPAADLFARARRGGTTERETTDLFGPPLDRASETVSNVHSSRTDSLTRLRYPGLEFGFYKIVQDHRELLRMVTLTDSTCELLPGLRVGARGRVLDRIFGRAAFRQVLVNDSVVVQIDLVGGEVPDFLDFILVRDTIRVIEWRFGLD
jgi:hypothetical protein